MLHNSSLNARLWVVVILAVIPLTLFSLADFRNQKASAAASMEEDVHVLLHAVKAEEAASIRQVRQTFRIIAAADEMRQIDAAACTGLSRRLLGTHEDFSNIGATWLDGRVFCSGLPLTTPVNVSDRRWYRDSLAAEDMTNGEYLVGRVSGIPSVTFGYPLRDTTGKLLATLFIASKMSWFERMAGHIHLPPGWEITLLKSDGTVLSHYPEAGEGRGGRLTPESFSSLKAADGDDDRIGEAVQADGSRHMVGVAPMASASGVLQILVSAPIGVSYAAVERTFYRQLVTLGLIALFSLMLARLYFLRLVEVWALRLAEGARRIAQGRFDERLPLGGGGRELNDVVSGFNAMADALAQREAAQRDAEEGLRASQEQLDLVLRASNDGWWDFDLARHRYFYSPHWYAMLGYESGEMAGDQGGGEMATGEGLWLEMLHPDDRGRAREAFNEALNGQVESFEMEFRMRHKSGNYVPVLSRAYIQRDAGGTAVRVSGANIDLSELKALDDELRKLSLAVEQSPASIVITDLEARIVYANPAFARVSGYSQREVAGQNPRILQSGKTPKGTYKEIWETLQRGAVWRGELINRRRDGSEFIERAMISPVRQEDGRITHYLAIKEDITDQKRVASELENYRAHLEEVVTRRTYELAEAKEAAERANQAKSTFLANMSHEIRTPMNAITGFVHLLSGSNLDEGQREKLAKIDRASQHLLRIINNVLDLSKIESGKLVPESLCFSPAEVLGMIAFMIRDAAQEKGVEVLVESTGLPGRVLGDETRLRQALLNFAANAVKFTRQGRIVVRGEVVYRDDAGYLLKFAVTDSGTGIPDAALSRLFKPFEQVDASTTRQHGGTGLGLVISRYLAELMGGTVGVESVPGHGSTFWLTVRVGHAPREGVAEAGGQVLPSVADQLRQRYSAAAVLLVEDDDVNREVGRGLLGAVGITVDFAADGRQALELAGARQYDLILMDIQMPVMDGLQATAELRSLASYRETPILALTANAFVEDRARYLAAGMNDVVAKPITPDVLYEKLLQWLPPAAPGEAVRPAMAGADHPAAPLAENEGKRETRRAALREGLLRLDGLLQTGNQEASSLFRKLLPELAQTGLGEVRSLQLAVENYDYSMASAHLARLIETMGLRRQ